MTSPSGFVLDTSVAIAWYLPERFAGEARTFRGRLSSGAIQCVVPSLHFWEFGNVLRTYVRRGELETDLAREVLELHLDAGLEVREPEPRRVFDAALEYGATVYDAVYIALALDSELLLLTAERTTTPWVVRLGERIVAVGREG